MSLRQLLSATPVAMPILAPAVFAATHAGPARYGEGQDVLAQEPPIA